MKNLIFLAHFATTLYLVGLIWIVQSLVYPSMGLVGADGYAAYHNLHTSRITPVVAPAMIVELVTAIYLVFVPLEGVDKRYFWCGLALVLAASQNRFEISSFRAGKKRTQGAADTAQTRTQAHHRYKLNEHQNR